MTDCATVKNDMIFLLTDLVASLPVEGEGRAGEAGALDPALQTDPLAHQEVLDTASGDCHRDPAYN